MSEALVSVDVETSGPSPSRYSLLSIGACLVDDPTCTFYVEIQPVSEEFVPEAMAVSGLSLATLASEGVAPSTAMEGFRDWLSASVAEGTTPVFAALNAPFDWMFVADYFHRYLGSNPFGHKALDIKALYMGVTGTEWRRSGYGTMATHYGLAEPLAHHALEDALAQAAILRHILADLERPTGPELERP